MLLKNNSRCMEISMREAQIHLGENPDIRLIDVRSPEEYRGGHIPGSLNIPLEQIAKIRQLIPDLDQELYVYCLSGARSRSACAMLAGMGYRNVNNIGGILRWRGEIVQSA